MKEFKVAVVAEGHMWIAARNADEALTAAQRYYDIRDAGTYRLSFEVAGDADV